MYSSLYSLNLKELFFFYIKKKIQFILLLQKKRKISMYVYNIFNFFYACTLI